MDPSTTWQQLGNGFPGLDPCTRAVFNVLAPVDPSSQVRKPIYVDVRVGLQPTPEQVWDFSDQLVVTVGQAEP